MSLGNEHRWRKFDQVSNNGASNLRPDDRCMFYMDRLHGGYDMSEANQKIVNLKIPMSFKGSTRWYYKQQAIQDFGNDLTRLTKGFKFLDGIAFVPMPPSKAKNHPEYDDRVFRACQIASINTGIPTLDIFEQKNSHEPFHENSFIRDIDMIQGNLQIQKNAIPDDIYVIVLVDDVLTTGAHFVACSNKLKSIYSGIIFGAFWAKQVTHEDESVENTSWI